MIMNKELLLDVNKKSVQSSFMCRSLHYTNYIAIIL